MAELLETIHTPTEHRYLQLMRAIWGGATLEQVFAATKIDPWFLKQIFLINETAMTVREAETLTPKLLKKAKLAGLSDVQVAHLRGLGDEARTPSANCAGPTVCARSTRPSTPAPPSSTPPRRTTTAATPTKPSCARANARL